MKSQYSEPYFKKRNKIKCIRQFKRRLSSVIRRKKRKGLYRGLNKIQRTQKRTVADHIKVTAPLNFSFLENTEEVILYVEKLKTLFKKRKKVLTDFSKVENISNDAIVLILAIIQNDKNAKYCDVRGNYPKNPKLRKILQESGLFEDKVPNSTKKNYILTRKNKKADGKIADELIRRVSKVIFGAEGHCPGVYRALMESMANTCYHAKPDIKAYETWHLTVYHNEKEGIVSFAFIDLGVGIFKSHKMRSFKEQWKSLIGRSDDNKDILVEILNGRKLSSTKIPYRGKGLPAIFKGLERNYFSNLKIISNDVKADIALNTYETIERDFSGTFLYWELNSTNRWMKLK